MTDSPPRREYLAIDPGPMGLTDLELVMQYAQTLNTIEHRDIKIVMTPAVLFELSQVQDERFLSYAENKAAIMGDLTEDTTSYKLAKLLEQYQDTVEYVHPSLVEIKAAQNSGTAKQYKNFADNSLVHWYHNLGVSDHPIVTVIGDDREMSLHMKQENMNHQQVPPWDHRSISTSAFRETMHRELGVLKELVADQTENVEPKIRTAGEEEAPVWYRGQLNSLFNAVRHTAKIDDVQKKFKQVEQGILKESYAELISETNKAGDNLLAYAVKNAHPQVVEFVYREMEQHLTKDEMRRMMTMSSEDGNNIFHDLAISASGRKHRSSESGLLESAAKWVFLKERMEDLFKSEAAATIKQLLEQKCNWEDGTQFIPIDKYNLPNSMRELFRKHGGQAELEP